MKKYIIFALMLLSTSSVMAQSGMTDDQVMSFVAKEHSAGTSNSQIVTKLMQRGVDISQIRRVREKYEKMQKQGSLASATDRTGNTSRLRSNNGKHVPTMENSPTKKLPTTPTIVCKPSATILTDTLTTAMTRNMATCKTS